MEPAARFFNAYRIVTLSAFNPDKRTYCQVDLKYPGRFAQQYVFCCAYLLFLSASTKVV
jgi:hypothetical protein